MADDPPSFWSHIGLDDIMHDSFVHRIPIDPSLKLQLQDEWLSPAELEERRLQEQRSTQIRPTFSKPSTSSTSGSLAPSSLHSTSSSVISTSTGGAPSPSQSSSTIHTSSGQATVPSQSSLGSPTVTHPTSTVFDSSVIQSQATSTHTSPSKVNYDNISDDGPSQLTTSASTSSKSSTSTPPRGSKSSPNAPRRSSRSNKGQFHSLKYIDAAYLTSVLDPTLSHYQATLAYQAECETDFDTSELNISDPRAYAARSRLNDPDSPSYYEALTGEDAHHYERAMEKEITELLKQNTWKSVPRAAVPKGKDGKKRRVLKGTWVFKLKRLPDGTPSKYKARYCT